jgi:site-specific recombinase XerD
MDYPLDQAIGYMKLSGYSEKTIKLYSSCLRNLCRHFMKTPLSLSTDELASFFIHLRDSSKSESTIHVHFEAVKRFYAYYGLSSLVPRLRLRHLKPRPPVVLSQVEVKSLLDACPSLRFKTLFTLIYSAGLRISEAANLQLPDVDFQRKQILVRNAKNGKSRYTVLGDRTQELLKHYINVFRPTEWLFFRKDNITQPISISHIQRYFKRLLVTADIH